MTLSDLEWPFHASRAISAVAEFFVYICFVFAVFDIRTKVDDRTRQLPWMCPGLLTSYSGGG